MERIDVESLIKTTTEEIEKVLSTKTIVGEPMTFEGKTVIPVSKVGFGFGAGGGSGGGKGKEGEGGEGSGGGAGGGASVCPVALIVIDKEKVEVMPLAKSSLGAALEKMVSYVPEVTGKVMAAKEKAKKSK
ncbi:MAG: hypothetical protein A7316_06085 [Candidatus Altiarchaeales archaeon WOR_SM1_86-2]|nr:MAG: hypothetical protein A7316_06085 [Candidatus Altiarchaeales archaeon WOR_SM1_86-2]ODS41372.1 MAG: hypothetical protein A7315_06445 [Candidatus Altiarchaeales archaeon WOR_SM1_79]